MEMMDGSRRRKTLILWLYLDKGDMPMLGGCWAGARVCRALGCFEEPACLSSAASACLAAFMEVSRLGLPIAREVYLA